ncbi:agmatinase [Nordella sp. HKS 07]|uniref:agmatinase n=1 Tax=Nordella sp. HKS 07 TaxID=2712222 RepID=UPI0013E1C911|nr:agmatinase [Nordella sp. HKS 07]QIG47482.1 agmatinase [Nordella sp. HKS 07]
MPGNDSVTFNQPVSGFVSPRFGGIATFMRLPHVPLDAAQGIDIGLAGIPWDGGTTNRPGPRHAPRQIRDNSAMVRRLHPVSHVFPYELANCADLGDCPVNPADVQDTLKRVETWFKKLVGQGVRPLVAGGDHLCSLPILRAVAEKRPVGMIHFDAHTDLYDEFFGGFRYTHGTPFRRAIEEGLLDPKRVVQIGIRGSMYDFEDVNYAEKAGVRIIRIEEAMEKGPKAIMAEARRIVGDGPTYVSFDIDMLDPVYAPGTGTPEIGGFTTFQAQQMLRELRGLNIVGADVVEVSPPFDPSGLTAYAGATMMFEILCPMAEDVAKRR